MTDETYRPADIEQRIANAQAARPHVDAHGKTVTSQTVHTYDADGVLQKAAPGHKMKPPVFTYDERGRLVTATPPTPDEVA